MSNNRVTNESKPAIVRALRIALMIALMAVTPFAFAGESYGLYAYSFNGLFENPCQIDYKVARLGDAKVRPPRYRLLMKADDKEQAEQFKRQFSQDGFDKPDTKFKKESCASYRLKHPEQDANNDSGLNQGHILLQPAKKKTPAKDKKPLLVQRFFLVLEVRYHANGYWTYHTGVTETPSNGYVRLRQLRCFVGPMRKQRAKLMQTQVRRSRELMRRLLGNRMENDVRGFKHRSDDCKISDT